MAKVEPAYTGEIRLGRALGLGGGVAMVVGSIIGMGIFALLAPITASAGNALWLAFVIAMIISAIGVIPIIQAASAIPACRHRLPADQPPFQPSAGQRHIPVGHTGRRLHDLLRLHRLRRQHSGLLVVGHR